MSVVTEQGANRREFIKMTALTAAGAKSVVLMMEDPDASGPKPFVHWLVANLPASVTSLPASLPKTERLAKGDLVGTYQRRPSR